MWRVDVVTKQLWSVPAIQLSHDAQRNAGNHTKYDEHQRDHNPDA
jgi:hypothetical protein